MAAIKYLEDSPKTIPGVKEKIEDMKKLYKEIHGLPYGDPRMEQIEVFIDWMRKNGAIFEKIQMHYYAHDYRGVHTMKDIEEFEIFLRVPENLIITSKRGKQTPIGAKMVASGIELDWDYLAYITVFFLTEYHNPTSFWRPYLDVYPKDVSCFPMFYTEEEKNMIKGSEMLKQVYDELEEIKSEYSKIAEAVPEFKQFSLEEYTRYKTLTISRIFYVTIHGVEDRIMVPLADMFNHHYERLGETRWCYDNQTDDFVVNAEKLIPKGDPICEHYGDKPNYRFLFYYGFLIENNNYNCIYVKLYFDKEDPDVIQKANMIGAYPDSEIKTFKYFEHYDMSEKHNNKFIGFLRFLEYRDDLNELKGYCIPEILDVTTCDFVRRKLRVPMLSIENERGALKRLKAIAKKCLPGYPDSYDTDMELLKKTDLTFNERNIIIFRSDEKRIYTEMIELADLGLQILDMEDFTKAQEQFNKIGKGKSYSLYFENILLPFLTSNDQ